MRPQPYLLALVFAALLSSPQQPDFSGTWVATTDAPRDIVSAPSPVFGARFNIRQDANAVALTRASRDGSLVVTMPLSGVEVRVPQPGRACEGDSARLEKMSFEGDALAYTLVGIQAPGATEPRAVNAKYLMRRESADTITVQGTMMQQGEPRLVATVYRRSTDAMPPAVTPAPLPAKGAPARIAQAEWIGATWIGSMANGVSVEERWTPAASGAMLGIGRTVRGTAMTGFEFLCIAEREDTLVYFAMPNARMPATPFVLTGVTAHSLTFENPGHDFPKIVRYTRLEDGSLETMIAAAPGVREQKFVLKRPQ